MLIYRHINARALRRLLVVASLISHALPFKVLAQELQPYASNAAKFTATEEVKEFIPPIAIVEAAAFGDGGTLYVRLSDSRGRQLALCVSRILDDVIPRDTLFLNAAHAYEKTARLPMTSAEAALAIASLENAVNAKLPAPKTPIKAGDWNAEIAQGALKRLEARSAYDVLDAATTNPPAWYAEYDTARQERLAQAERERQIEEAFVNSFPPHARHCFDLPADENEEFEETEKRQGEALADAVTDRVELTSCICRAFGVRNDSWNMSVSSDRVVEHALPRITGHDFASALEGCKDDATALLGAAKLYFWFEFDRKLTNEERLVWGVRLAEAVLNSNHEDNDSLVLRSIARLDSPSVDEVLWRVARNAPEEEKEASANDTREPSLSAMTVLMLAQRKHPDADGELKDRLRSAEGQDRIAYEVALALLGDSQYVKSDNFDTESHLVAFSAIKAIEQFEGAAGMDVLFGSGLMHPWAAIRNESLLAAQRLTGQEWHRKGSRLQPGASGEEAQAWWKANREEFLKQKQESARKD